MEVDKDVQGKTTVVLTVRAPSGPLLSARLLPASSPPGTLRASSCRLARSLTLAFRALVQGATFASNTARNAGGAVHLSGLDANVVDRLPRRYFALTLTSCVFSRNSCSSGGGAINIFSGSAVLVNNTRFDFNTATGVSARGGAICAESVGNFTSMQNSNYTSNSVMGDISSPATLGQSQVVTFGAESGGAIFIAAPMSSITAFLSKAITGTPDPVLTGMRDKWWSAKLSGTFTSNNATRAGGAVAGADVQLQARRRRLRRAVSASPLLVSPMRSAALCCLRVTPIPTPRRLSTPPSHTTAPLRSPRTARTRRAGPST